jgi:hypothetical protein
VSRCSWIDIPVTITTDAHLEAQSYRTLRGERICIVEILLRDFLQVRSSIFVGLGTASWMLATRIHIDRRPDLVMTTMQSTYNSQLFMAIAI